MSAKLYAIPGSAPSRTGQLMLEHKGIDHKRVDLVAPTHRVMLRLQGFEAPTVPAVKLDGRRIQGTRTISRELDQIVPEAPLFPADPDRRAAVEEAERWGDEVLQAGPRRLAWWGVKRDRRAVRSFLEGSSSSARLGLPVGLAAKTARPNIRMSARLTEATDEAVRDDLAALPGMLDKVDGWIGAGVLGGEELSAADFQIATNVRLLMCFEELRPGVEARPAGALAMRVCPDYAGQIGPVFAAAGLQVPI